MQLFSCRNTASERFWVSYSATEDAQAFKLSQGGRGGGEVMASLVTYGHVYVCAWLLSSSLAKLLNLGGWGGDDLVKCIYVYCINFI